MHQLSLNEHEEEDEATYQLQGCVSELKVCHDTAAENKCYMNMFGETAKLTANALCKGKVVETVSIFGILEAVHQHQQAILLKLNIDYFNIDYFKCHCTFRKCRMSPFVGLLTLNLTICMLSSISNKSIYVF